MISRSISLRSLLEELSANGMQHGSRSPSLEKIQCLEMLAAHETAWRALRWTGSTPVDTLIGWGEPVSVSGNVLCLRTNPGMPRKELLLRRAQSKLRNVVGKTWWIYLSHDTRCLYRRCAGFAHLLVMCYEDLLPPSPSSLPLHSGSNPSGSAPFIREKSSTCAACRRHQRYKHMTILHWKYACLWRQLRRCM